jgi:hypothetical protein
MGLDALISKYRDETCEMLRNAELNPRETGDSIYMQRAIRCTKLADALEAVREENPDAA